MILAVRWHLRYGLFYRNVEGLFAERSVRRACAARQQSRRQDQPNGGPLRARTMGRSARDSRDPLVHQLVRAAGCRRASDQLPDRAMEESRGGEFL